MRIVFISIALILIVGCLPYALWTIYRIRQPLAFVMLIGSVLVWGGAIAILTAEPKLVSTQHGKESGLAHQTYVQRSEEGEYALVGGAFLFLLSGIALKLGGGASK